ncbi:MAG: 50S ribosomal protein L6 [Candidatus Hydrogenedentota bacterium]
MSRIGRYPVTLPTGVKCELKGVRLTVTGPKGALEQDFSPRMTIKVAGDTVTVVRPTDDKQDRATHGLTRALINNMVVGVSEGFTKTLQIEGVGYRASMQGNKLNLAIGYSHPVILDPPEGISFELDGTQTVKISGIDKQQVGQVAADIRALRKPEPYKGKGVRYADEYVRRKVGKAGAK